MSYELASGAVAVPPPAHAAPLIRSLTLPQSLRGTSGNASRYVPFNIWVNALLFRRNRPQSNTPYAKGHEVKHVFREDISEDDLWRLIEWCRSKGGDEFTFEFLGYGDSRTAESWAKMESILQDYRLGNADRPVLTAAPGRPFVQTVETWKLVPSSIVALHEVFPDGIREYITTDYGWAEDLIVYRNGLLMFGYVSHEGEGVIQVRPNEVSSLLGLGMTLRDEGKWVG